MIWEVGQDCRLVRRARAPAESHLPAESLPGRILPSRALLAVCLPASSFYADPNTVCQVIEGSLRSTFAIEPLGERDATRVVVTRPTGCCDAGSRGMSAGAHRPRRWLLTRPHLPRHGQRQMRAAQPLPRPPCLFRAGTAHEICRGGMRTTPPPSARRQGVAAGRHHHRPRGGRGRRCHSAARRSTAYSSPGRHCHFDRK